MSFSAFVKRQLTELETIEIFDETVGDDLREMISEVERKAADCGLPDAVRACQIRPGGVGIGTARRVLAACLAGAEKPEPPSEWVTLSEAAGILGMSDSGLRKLVCRREIQFSQPRKGAVIRFRREWLSEFAEPAKLAGSARTNKRQPKPPKPKGDFSRWDSLPR